MGLDRAGHLRCDARMDASTRIACIDVSVMLVPDTCGGKRCVCVCVCVGGGGGMTFEW